MKSKIFNTDQIRAIQDGRMTQFMQVVKPQPWSMAEKGGAGFAWDKKGPDSSSYKWNTNMQSLGNHMAEESPFGKIGDILYCRGTWWGGYELNDNDHITEGTPLRYWYFADGRDARPGDMSDSKCYHLFGGDKSDWPAWRSPATMPREAARLFLRITNIRVMRVQELTEEDAIKQGVEYIVTPIIQGYRDYSPKPKEIIEAITNTALSSIQSLDEKRWQNNPYMWIIDFTKIEKP